MTLTNAWWQFSNLKIHRALLIIGIINSLLIAACKPTPTTSNSDNDTCAVSLGLELDEELSEAAMRCHTPETIDAPVLYAHYLAQSIQEEICAEDVAEYSQGAINCAPGPVLLAHGNSIDTQDRDWRLSALPDYFAWHLNGKAGGEELMYIANANGFPIKSQSVKLENGHESTLVLFPKTTLTPGARYYLYLVRESRRWIQPIVTTASTR